MDFTLPYLSQTRTAHCDYNCVPPKYCTSAGPSEELRLVHPMPIARRKIRLGRVSLH